MVALFTPFTEEQRDAIVDQYESGVTVVELRSQFRCRQSRITDVLHERGIDPVKRRFRHSPEQRRAIAERYAAGELSASIAADYGGTTTTIRNAARDEGVPINSRGNRYRQFSREEIEDMATRWQSGESQGSIAGSFDTIQSVISRVLISNGYRRPSDRIKPKGGRYLSPEGYWKVYIEPDHPFASMRPRAGYTPEHRLVMAEHLGRPLRRSEQVHHIDGNRQNNAIENLQLRQGWHGKGVIMKCACCGSTDIISVKLDES